MQPDKVQESSIHLQHPCEIEVHVHFLSWSHGTRCAVDILWRHILRHIAWICDGDIVILRVADPEAGAKDVGRVVVPGPVTARVLGGRNRLASDVEPVHGLHRRARIDFELLEAAVASNHVGNGEVEEVGGGYDLDAVDERVGVGVALLRGEGEVERLGRDVDGELPDEVRVGDRGSRLVGAEVGKQRELSARDGDGDGEETVGGVAVGVVGRVEVEPEELAARAEREGVGEGRGRDPRGEVRHLRDRGILAGGGGHRGEVVRRGVLGARVPGPHPAVRVVALPLGAAVQQDVVPRHERRGGGVGVGPSRRLRRRRGASGQQQRQQQQDPHGGEPHSQIGHQAAPPRRSGVDFAAGVGGGGEICGGGEGGSRSSRPRVGKGGGEGGGAGVRGGREGGEDSGLRAVRH